MMIRKLTENDYAQWKSLWQDYLDFYVSEISEEITNTTFSRLLTEGEPMYCLVAEEQGKLTGLVHFICHRNTWSIGDYCYLEDLFVSADGRKKGTGRALIEAVNTAAEAMNCSKVYWMTRENNYRARALYDQMATKTDFVQYRDTR
ncbi:GNAT family N-acetyltransferase [Pantoea rodasii]|uniref:GNAT family N-acetyltransferase n=1 Tax=Pantoea rodasii TaxID=1076549 RepID=A0A2M9W6S2_9GAMM|nr:GNAT family N-acetyltransferase [Pantoea rodasii]PJZ03219.1 GNAT family N-acetyltransferase [Pantoea rodasii]